MRKRKRQQLKKQNRAKKYFIILLVFISAIIIISNDFGLMRLIQLKQTRHQLQNNIHTLINQQSKLNSEIFELKTNTQYIEKIAREKFMMAKPGEKIFKVIEYKQMN